MFDRMRIVCALALLTPLAFVGMASGAIAQDGVWRVSKISGDVSMITTAGAVALADGAALKPGDNVRTGQNGRILLVRGQESMLISPNTVMSISKDKLESLSTTIIQQTGSILLEVEKRNVKHFKVETPYLAAVVKGTQFRVTVDESGAQVDVTRGQVEVTDYRSGQYVLVQPNQAARVAALRPGLSVGGSGTLNPIQQGTPRSSPISPAPMPRASAPAPSSRKISLAGDPTSDSAPMPRASAPAPSSRKISLAGDPTSDSAPTSPWVHDAQSGTPELLTPVSAGNEGLWDATVTTVGKWFGFSNTGHSRNEDLTLGAALAGGIGLFVSIGVSVQRRRRRKNQGPE